MKGILVWQASSFPEVRITIGYSIYSNDFFSSLGIEAMIELGEDISATASTKDIESSPQWRKYYHILLCKSKQLNKKTWQIIQ